MNPSRPPAFETSPSTAPARRRLRYLPAFARALYKAVTQWLEAGGMRMSAAMSFYGVLSLAPLLVILVAFLGWWLDRNALEASLVQQIGSVMGEQGAQIVKQALASAQEPSQGITASVIAFVLLLFGATGVFAELQDALERLWRQGSGEVPVQKWWYSASLRLRGVAYILAFGFLLLVSLVVSTMLGMFSGWAGTYVPIEKFAWVINEVVSFAFCVALFVGLMSISSGPKPLTRYLVLGASIGAILFAVGKQLLALYLSKAAVVSAYGAAGSLVVVLMWIYFSSAVLLLAASVARAASDEALNSAKPRSADTAA